MTFLCRGLRGWPALELQARLGTGVAAMCVPHADRQLALLPEGMIALISAGRYHVGGHRSICCFFANSLCVVGKAAGRR